MMKEEPKMRVILSLIFALICSTKQDTLDLCWICFCSCGVNPQLSCSPLVEGNSSDALQPGLPCIYSNVTILTLYHTNIRSINDSVLLCFPAVQHVLITHNELQEIPRFHNHQYLSTLRLDRNIIHEISPLFGSSVPNLKRLYISFNKLRQIEGTWLPHLLIHFDLSGNLIHTVTNKTFVGLEQLEFLNLDQNRICVIPCGTFLLPKLTAIQLRFNQISTMDNQSFPDALLSIRLDGNRLDNILVLEHTSRLEQVVVRQQSNSRFHQSALPDFPSLRVADASGVTNNSFLSTIQAKAPNLWLLVVTSGHIPHVHLVKHAHLTSLDLSSNHIETIQGLGAVSSLATIILSNNLLRTIPDFTDHTAIQFIHMDNNKISALQAVSFSTLPSLLGINLAGNLITSIVGHLTNPRLSVIVLSKNYIDRFDLDVFSHLPGLQYLHMEENKLSMGSNITSVERLHEMYCQDNAISRIDATSFSYLPNLYSLDLSNNIIRQVSEFPFLPKLSILTLDNNPLVVIGDHAFSFLLSLRNIYLRNTGLEHFPAPSTVMQWVDTLNLGENSIRSIPNTTTHLFPSLKHLDLSHNNIDDLNTTELSQLQVLKINGNLIPSSSINCSLFRDLDTFHADLSSLQTSCLTHLIQTFKGILFLQGSHIFRVPASIVCRRERAGIVHLADVQLDLSNCSCIMPEPPCQSNRSRDHPAGTLLLQNVSLYDPRISSGVVLGKTSSFSFVESGLLDIPTWEAPDVWFMNLSSNLIRTFNVSSFTEQYPKAEHLYLNNNRIQFLSGCYETCRIHHPLIRLNLSGNDLVQFPGWSCSGDIYRVFISLQMIDLSYNYLTNISRGLIPQSSKSMPRFVVQISLRENNLKCTCPERWLLDVEDDITIFRSCLSQTMETQIETMHFLTNDFSCPLSFTVEKSCTIEENGVVSIQCPVTSHPSPHIQWIFQQSPETMAIGFPQMNTELVSIQDTRVTLLPGGLQFIPNNSYASANVLVACRAVDSWQNSLLLFINVLTSESPEGQDSGGDRNLSVVCLIEDSRVSPVTRRAHSDMNMNVTPLSGQTVVSRGPYHCNHMGVCLLLFAVLASYVK